MSLLRAVWVIACGPLCLLADEPAGLSCTGQRACCILPRAASVPWFTAPTSIDACESPRANCARPAALQVRQSPRCATPVNRSINEILTQWESASKFQFCWSERQREWLRRQASERLSAHAADLVLKLTQPVTLTWLQHEFEWQIASQSSPTVTLFATPRDEAVRLFCRELRIEIDTESGVPVTVQIVPRTGTVQAVALHSEAVLTADSVLLVADEHTVPPSPSTASLIRFASGVLDVDQRSPSRSAR